MADSEVQTKTVNLQVVEDFSKDSERFPITRAMEVEMLQKQSGEKKGGFQGIRKGPRMQ